MDKKVAITSKQFPIQLARMGAEWKEEQGDRLPA